MIFLLASFGSAILDDMRTLAFGAKVFNRFCYHAYMIPSVTSLPLPLISILEGSKSSITWLNR